MIVRSIELCECECHYSPALARHTQQCCARCEVCGQDIKTAYAEEHRKRHEENGEHTSARWPKFLNI